MDNNYWKCFYNDGKLFEKFCADLIKQSICNENIEIRDAHDIGGADRGKDIVLYKMINGLKEGIAVVECKSRVSKSSSALSLKDLSKTILYGMNRNIDKVIYITNFKFNSNAVEQFEDINHSNNWPLSVIWIEGKELAQISNQFPTIYQKYCKKEPIINDDDITNITNISDFINTDSKDNILIKNLDLNSKKIKVSINNETQEYVIKSLSHTNIKLPDNIKNINIKCDYSDFTINKSITIDKFYIPINYIYVDPYENLNNIINSEQDVIYIEGEAGSGKSRLLNELNNNVHSAIQIDLSSSDYEHSLNEYIINKIFSLQFNDINDISDEIIEKYFRINEIPDKEIQDFISFMKSKNEIDHKLNQELKMNTIANIAMVLFKNKTLIIDNIHKLSPADILLLKKIIDNNISTKIIISARDNEIEYSDLTSYLLWLSDKITIITLESNPKHLLEAFIKKASSNKYTKTFLLKHTNTKSIQEFMFLLKKLKTQNILTQTSHGKIEIKLDSELSISSYEDIFLTIIKNIKNKIGNSNIINIVQDASIYGYTFPAEYLIEKYGNETMDIIDELIYYEVFKESRFKSEDKFWLNFDHELTQKIAYKSNKPLRRKNEHKNIANYLKSDKSFKIGKDSGKLAHHYENSAQYEKSIKSYYKNAKFLYHIGQLKDSIKPLDKSFKIFSYLDDKNTKMTIKEAKIIDTSLLIYNELGKSKSDIIKKLNAFDLHVNLNKHIVPKKYITKVQYYNILFNGVPKDYYDNLKSIIQDFSNQKEYREEIQARILLSNKLKNKAIFNKAFKEGEKAISKAKKSKKYEDLLADAYLDYGAIFLESNQFEKVLPFWDKAVHVLEGTNYIGKLCFAMTDRAYIYALVSPNDLHTEKYLLDSIGFSKHYKLVREECRSIINYINWAYYHTAYKKKIINKFFERLDILLKNLDNEYLEILVSFTKVNFNLVSSKEYNKCKEILRQYISQENLSSIDSIGDQRIKNIIYWFSKHHKKDINYNIVEKENLYSMKNGKYAVYY